MGTTTAQALLETTTTTAQALAGDFLIVLVLGIALFAFGLRVKKRGIINLVFSLYVGLGLFTLFPYLKEVLALTSTPLISLLFILGLLGIFTLVPYRILRRVITAEYISGNVLFFSVVFALLLTGLLLASAYHLLGIKAYYDFTPAMDVLFAPKEYFYYWFIAPLVALLVLGR